MHALSGMGLRTIVAAAAVAAAYIIYYMMMRSDAVVSDSAYIVDSINLFGV